LAAANLPESALRTGSYGSVNAILPLLEYLENEGFDLNGILDRAGIRKSALEDTQTRFPKGTFEALWQVAIEATGDPAIALRVSTMVKANTLGIIGYLASASESGRNAFELVRGLTPLLWEDFQCDLESDGEVAFIRCNTGCHPQASRITTEYAIGLTVTMSRVLGAPRSDPLEARFSYSAPAYADEYERILRLPVRFDAGEDGVLFPIAMLDSSNPSADASLRQLLERYAAEQLARIPTSARFSQRVRACIRSMLPLGSLTADTVAAEFSMSNRTLRRRLQEEATSYQEILDDVRAELARHYLTKEKRGIDDVAFLLGFSDPSAFTKAFRRWTGQTPADFVRETHPDSSPG
jgi:AraC-like DNA-binding protein